MSHRDLEIVRGTLAAGGILLVLFVVGAFLPGFDPEVAFAAGALWFVVMLTVLGLAKSRNSKELARSDGHEHGKNNLGLLGSVRVMIVNVFVLTLSISGTIAYISGNPLLLALGFLMGISGAGVLLLSWRFSQSSMRDRGFRW